MNTWLLMMSLSSSLSVLSPSGPRKFGMLKVSTVLPLQRDVDSGAASGLAAVGDRARHWRTVRVATTPADVPRRRAVPHAFTYF